MAEVNISVLKDCFLCSVCKEIMKNPVSLICGHNFCSRCLKKVPGWYGGYTCTLCKERFSSGPAVNINTLLAEIIEKVKKEELSYTTLMSYTGSEVVPCDVCTGGNVKALKTCLTCLASYCETHIQPHRESAALRRHKLEQPIGNIHQKLCPQHLRLLEFFCRKDQRCICSECVLTEHKGHELVRPELESSEKKKEVKVTIDKIKQGIYKKEKQMMDTRVAVEKLQRDTANGVREYEDIFRFLSSEVTKLIRDNEKNQVRKGDELMKQLEKEIEELKREGTELAELSQVVDHIHFLQKLSSVALPNEDENTATVVGDLLPEPLRKSLSDVIKYMEEYSGWGIPKPKGLLEQSTKATSRSEPLNEPAKFVQKNSLPDQSLEIKNTTAMPDPDPKSSSGVRSLFSSVNIEVDGTERTLGAGEAFLGKLTEKLRRNQTQLNTSKLTNSTDTLVLVFCPVASRILTDINGALQSILSKKNVILVVMHHTHKPGHTVTESKRLVQQSNVMETVDCLFYENQGLLDCSLNSESLEKVANILGGSLQMQH
ncbi:E3 ubiquitin/ISG15 ligase TRIM25-like isoform X2 [Erpetoichthys calabaricus]|uniref:E3 ubiquitin/ISG15 ligase TRIM25-like isoform X2 n=1 Tax=Erpetoichthys calabaricus TaxID=27687 RepID=UPI00223409F2|nr:E3 ubiquitin/ISG15 ligase TRIM25-like isoform X2 [Erpetoichthys calabaricus]